MIVAYNVAGGELRQHSYQNLGTTGVYGKWVRVNTIHNASAGTAEIYINGSRKGTMSGSWSGGPNGFYHKYGVYNGSQHRPQAEWRNVKYFRK